MHICPIYVWEMSALAVTLAIMSSCRQRMVWMSSSTQSTAEALELHQDSSGLQQPSPGWLVVTCGTLEP